VRFNVLDDLDIPEPPGLHDDDEEAVDEEVAAAPRRAKLQRPQLPSALTPEEQEYFNLSSVIDRIRARMEEVDDNADFLDEDNRVNSYAIVVWLKLVSEFRQAVEAWNRMKNTDRLTKGILQAHTKRHTQNVAEPLVGKFEVVLTNLRKSGTDEFVINQLEHLFGHEVREVLLRAAEESVRESCEAYRLN